MIADLLGGIGLFLLGMMLMTEGMEEAAGEGLHALLKRATGNRVRGTVFGATLTLVVQSSTASTLATIGFVSAGLLTFYESLAVIVGTNVGTTSTGWLVSLIGFRISVSSFALPLVGIGALLRMLARGRLAALGFVCAGLGSSLSVSTCSRPGWLMSRTVSTWVGSTAIRSSAAWRSLLLDWS